MITFQAKVRISKLYSSEWEMNGKKGRSYKAQLIDEDSKFAPILDVNPSLFDSLELSNPEKASIFLKKNVNIDLEGETRVFDGKSNFKLKIVGISLPK